MSGWDRETAKWTTAFTTEFTNGGIGHGVEKWEEDVGFNPHCEFENHYAGCWDL